ncbi:alanine/glycine:cation symporter family protein [Persicobacter diffluens]|uniref:Sodium:alanine symporter n=1 Tax=Persicobacter diffluens TaxID=981 RepID=A0AAN4VY26_9BACT|nr:sodium:alanine symporter [Persicobacter diffluens]
MQDSLLSSIQNGLLWALNSSNNFLWSYVLIAVLILAGLYFTINSGFVQFGMFKEMVKLLADGRSKSESKGTSSFQAFCMSTASRVGTGNLAGVALAVGAGGPGAVFWMWLIALIGSASAFVESTLAQIYKEKTPHGFRGGPAYYMEKALGNRSLGIVFSILITICFGFIFNAVQANTIAAAFHGAFDIEAKWMALILVVISAPVIMGGVRRIAVVAEVIVPIMAIAYLFIVIYVLVVNFSQIPAVISLILESAFGLREMAAGAVGAALMQGIKRGLFSNEAGMGSAPNAAATASVSHPVKQGLIQTLGVFTDTILICTATAMLILVSGVEAAGAEDGIKLTQAALQSQVGSWGGIFIAVAILLFAYSSIIGNYYYGEANIDFIHRGDSKLKMIYRFAALGMLVFGALVKVQTVWDMADLFMALMALVNIYAIIKLGPIAFAALKDYRQQKKEGKDPVFRASNIGIKEGAECWEEPKEQVVL